MTTSHALLSLEAFFLSFKEKLKEFAHLVFIYFYLVIFLYIDNNVTPPQCHQAGYILKAEVCFQHFTYLKLLCIAVLTFSSNINQFFSLLKFQTRPELELTKCINFDCTVYNTSM